MSDDVEMANLRKKVTTIMIQQEEKVNTRAKELEEVPHDALCIAYAFLEGVFKTTAEENIKLEDKLKWKPIAQWWYAETGTAVLGRWMDGEEGETAMWKEYYIRLDSGGLPLHYLRTFTHFYLIPSPPEAS